MEDTRYPFIPQTAVTGPLASSRQSRRSLYHRLLLEFGSGTTSTTSKMYVCRLTLQTHSNNALPGNKTPTAPLTARSSPLLIVVPTAMKSLVPDSVLEVSNVTISRALTNSLGANSYLPNQKVSTELQGQLTLKDQGYVPIHRRPCIGLDQFQSGTLRSGKRHVVSCMKREGYRKHVRHKSNEAGGQPHRQAPKADCHPRQTRRTLLVT